VTKKLLGFTALAEGGFGLLLVVAPAAVGRLLFDADVSGIAITVGRLTGMCLIALAIACWPSGESRSALYGMLTWSVLAMLYLLRIGIRGAPVGSLLWPAVVVHGVIAVLLFFQAVRRT
jgi:hypothetical protein